MQRISQDIEIERPRDGDGDMQILRGERDNKMQKIGQEIERGI